MKSRSHEIDALNCCIALKFDRHIGSHAAEVPVKFQSDRTILNTNLAASILYEILRKDVLSDIETGPWVLWSCMFSLLLAFTLCLRTVELPVIWHYNDVIMSAKVSQITSLAIVYSAFNPGADQRKHQSSVSLAFVRGIHRWPVKFPAYKGPVTWKMFQFDDVVIKWHEADLSAL